MTSLLFCVSRFPVGSSARISVGRVIRARPIATRCCCPPDNWLGKWLRRSFRLRTVSSSSRYFCPASDSQAVPENNILLYRQLRNQIKRLKIKPIFRRRKIVRFRSSIAKISLPSISTLPDAGMSNAPIILSSVLFPEPDSPTIATYSPFGTEKLTFFSAFTAVSPLPYVLLIFLLPIGP